MRHIKWESVFFLSSAFMVLGVWPADVWGIQLAKLDIPTGSSWYGFSVATDGEYAVVGDIGFDAAISQTGGTAIVYRRVGNDWVQDAMLIPDTVAPQLQLYGYTVAIDQGLIIVGSNFDMSVCNPVGDCGMGSAHVFRHEPGGWVFEAKLFPTETLPDNARFGTFVSISGSRALVSSLRESTPSSSGFSSVFYVFRREGTSWVEEARLTPSDVSDTGNVGFAGPAHAIDGDQLLIGAINISGIPSAYVFRRVGTTWSEEAKLDLPASEDVGLAGIVGPSHVALSGNLAVISGSRSNAFVFRHGAGSWSLDGTLSNLDIVPGNVEQSTMVSIDGPNVLVTTLSGNSNTPPASTFAVYSRENSLWQRTSVIQPAQDVVVSTNAVPVDMRNGVVMFGARLSSGTFDFSTNTAYLFTVGNVPAVTAWGVVIMGLMLITAATCLVKFRASMA